MLSVFPQLLDYSFFAPFILRVGLALVALRLGYLNLKEVKKFPKTTGAMLVIGAIFLALGFLTQIAVLLIIIAGLAEVIRAKIKELPVPEKTLKFLVFVAAVSLILLGSGAFAIDLPL